MLLGRSTRTWTPRWPRGASAARAGRTATRPACPSRPFYRRPSRPRPSSPRARRRRTRATRRRCPPTRRRRPRTRPSPSRRSCPTRRRRACPTRGPRACLQRLTSGESDASGSVRRGSGVGGSSGVGTHRRALGILFTSGDQSCSSSSRRAGAFVMSAKTIVCSVGGRSVTDSSPSAAPPATCPWTGCVRLRGHRGGP